jgi:hypothetical protein
LSFLRVLGLVVTTVLAAPSFPCAADELEDGRHEVTSSIKGEPVVVVVQIVGGRGCVDPASMKWGGVEGTCPTHRVGSIAVTFAAHDAIIAASAYSDITSLRKVEVDPAPAGFEVTLRGGDAGTGYTAVLSFSLESSRRIPVLVSRRASSSENPDRSRDRFEYQFESIDADY